MSAAARSGGAALWGVLRTLAEIHFRRLSIRCPAAAMTSAGVSMATARPLTTSVFRSATESASTSYSRANVAVDARACAPLLGTHPRSARTLKAPFAAVLGKCGSASTGCVEGTRLALQRKLLLGNQMASGNAACTLRAKRSFHISAVAQTQSLTKEGKQLPTLKPGVTHSCLVICFFLRL